MNHIDDFQNRSFSYHLSFLFDSWRNIVESGVKHHNPNPIVVIVLAAMNEWQVSFAIIQRYQNNLKNNNNLC